METKMFPPYKKFKVIVYFIFNIFSDGCESVYFSSKQIALGCREATKRQQGREKVNKSDEQAMDGGWKGIGVIAGWNESIRYYTWNGNVIIDILKSKKWKKSNHKKKP